MNSKKVSNIVITFSLILILIYVFSVGYVFGQESGHSGQIIYMLQADSIKELNAKMYEIVDDGFHIDDMECFNGYLYCLVTVSK